MASQAVKQFRSREIVSFLKSNPKAETPFKVPNPFLPRLNPDTGRWAPAKYSLRRQADLVKNARASDLLHLLPPGPKLAPKDIQSALEARPQSVTAAAAVAAARKRDLWQTAVQWEGEVKAKPVPGSDVGNRLYAGKWRMFKGHKWERTREKRLKKREFLMKGMKTRIMRFKSTYRKRRPSPLSRPKNTGKAAKLPF